jgi:curli biogenesis system outer membrane secretion channel CsgG
MKRTAVLSLCALLPFALSAGLVAQSASAPVQTAKPHKPPVHQEPAERAFQANCSRCHYAPESLSPRITGTVVRHMRVRANLSAEEERLILSYLNP